MNTLIDPALVNRLQAIRAAYDTGLLTSIPYIEPRREHDFSHFTDIIEVKKDDDDKGSGGGGGTMRGFRKNTKARAQSSRRT